MSIAWIIAVVYVTTLMPVATVASVPAVDESQNETNNAFVELNNYYDKKFSLMNAKFEKWKGILMKEISILQDARKVPENARTADHASEAKSQESPYADASIESIAEQQLFQKANENSTAFSKNRKSTRIGHQLRAAGNAGNGNIAFDAILSQNIGDLWHGRAIIFDQTNINLGESYDTNSGKFTCKIAGVYVFYVRLLVLQRRTLYTELVKNGAHIHEMYTHDEDTFGHSATLAIQHLQLGDDVWVRPSQYQGESLTGHKVLDGGLCSFSGFLLYPD